MVTSITMHTFDDFSSASVSALQQSQSTTLDESAAVTVIVSVSDDKTSKVYHVNMQTLVTAPVTSTSLPPIPPAMTSKN